MQGQRLSSAHEKYVGDPILYRKDMLSRYEYNNASSSKYIQAKLELFSRRQLLLLLKAY